jgi:hypothetical protein
VGGLAGGGSARQVAGGGGGGGPPPPPPPHCATRGGSTAVAARESEHGTVAAAAHAAAAILVSQAAETRVLGQQCSRRDGPADVRRGRMCGLIARKKRRCSCWRAHWRAAAADSGTAWRVLAHTRKRRCGSSRQPTQAVPARGSRTAHSTARQRQHAALGVQKQRRGPVRQGTAARRGGGRGRSASRSPPPH